MRTSGKMKRGESAISDILIGYLNYRIDCTRRERRRHRNKQAIRHHRKCRRGSSREAGGITEDSIPILAREEWECVSVEWAWKEYKDA